LANLWLAQTQASYKTIGECEVVIGELISNGHSGSYHRSSAGCTPCMRINDICTMDEVVSDLRIQVIFNWWYISGDAFSSSSRCQIYCDSADMVVVSGNPFATSSECQSYCDSLASINTFIPKNFSKMDCTQCEICTYVR